MPYDIKLLGSAAKELRSFRVYDQRRISDGIENHLRHQPTMESRNCKCMRGFSPIFDHVPPVWELRVGDFRVFYDVDEDAQVVYVRAVRLKEHGKTTEDIT
jgi:mRNA-degrading endonuclease RelE of RelBE toxin-antitoxin system